MTQAITVKRGKARIVVTMMGCVRCGSEWSPLWHDADRVRVIVGDAEEAMQLYVCAYCAASPQGGRL